MEALTREPPLAPSDLEGGSSLVSTHARIYDILAAPMSATRRKPTNELEFQGQVLGWINDELRRRPGLGLDRATQEKPRLSSGKRSDVIVWKDRATESPFLALELKTPATSITSPELFADAIEKAQHWKAPYVAIWNMQSAELYRTPRLGMRVTPDQAIKRWSLQDKVTRLEDWLHPDVSTALQRLALELVETAWANDAIGDVAGHVIDSEIFVARLSEAISRLRISLYHALLERVQASAKVRTKIRRIAAEQGFIGFVEDIHYALAGQIGYRLVGQILFYFAFRRKQPALRALVVEPKESLPEALQPFWDDVRRYDYEALFKPADIDDLVEIPDEGQVLLRTLIGHLGAYDWSSLSDDVLGTVFERLIPRSEQILLGQFYTPRPVADLLVALTLDGERPIVVDPGCGSGTFLMAAYECLAARQKISHQDLLSTIWGFDLSPFAAQLASINLYRQNLAEFDNFPRICVGSFFGREPGQSIEFPPSRISAGAPRKVMVPIPKFDCILGNPPFLRSQNQDDLDPEYRRQLFQAAILAGVKAEAKTDLFGFFIFHALRFMKVGSRLGFVTPASWLTSDYAASLQTVLTGSLRLIALISSSAESFFPQVEIHTVLLLAERVDEAVDEPDAVLRFVALKQTIAELNGGTGPYWDRVIELADAILEHESSYEDERMRIHTVLLASERSALLAEPTVPRNWSKHLRAPSSFEKLANDPAFTELKNVAQVSLGYKSLQNDFYYLNKATIDTYAIEPRFLEPIFMLGDLNARAFIQSSEYAQWIFLCREKESDLRGSGALRYIDVMAERPAAKRKQSGAWLTIRQVLEAQSGGLWYGPKARPHASHIWLRKAFDTVYAPFVFEAARVVDQRCNYLDPIEGQCWEPLAAAITSTVFAFALEISGSASMGGGALEAPTTKLREYIVLDIRELDKAAQEELVCLARVVWSQEAPVDWGVPDSLPGPAQRALDQWILNRSSTSNPNNRLTLTRLYDDIRLACRIRIGVAKDKSKAKKRQQTESVASVARRIADTLARSLRSRQFPEHFALAGASIGMHIPHDRLRRIVMVRLLDKIEVSMLGAGSKVLSRETYDAAIAETIVRAALLGRENFQLPLDRSICETAIRDFLTWFDELKVRMSAAIEESSLGTGYEESLRHDVYNRLGIHPKVGERTLPSEIAWVLRQELLGTQST